ncbi:hypothetical protein J3R83DRAFT_6013 [Lanmaoa asiatica]|nr:hypothetical protein J3R83DRAFT_6013 [Lanmaoa asiatica]
MPPTTENAQLQYPCSIPGCNRWFKNQSGLTQHLHAKHPRVSLSPTPSPVPSSPPRCPSVPPLQFPDSPNVQPSQLPSPEVLEQLYAEYLGPSNSIFRNYHPFLTGNGNHVMLWESSYQLVHHLRLGSGTPKMTGLPSTVASNSNWQIFYTLATRCRQNKSTHFWIYGLKVSVMSAVDLFSQPTMTSTTPLMPSHLVMSSGRVSL